MPRSSKIAGVVKKPAAAKAPKKPQKKKGMVSQVARMGLSGLSGLANSYAPGSGLLVDKIGKTILNAFGLAEITKLPDFGSGKGGILTQAGGEIVSAADAPVAFGRQESPTTFAKVLHRTPEGDVIMHLKEWYADVQTAGTTNTFQLNVINMAPIQTNLPLHSSIAEAYQHFKVLGVRPHYVHFASTSTVARVGLYYVEDFNSMSSNPNTATFGELSRLEDVAVGSAYEDFSLIAQPDQQINWYDTYESPNMGLDEDPRFSVQGAVCYTVDQNTSTSTPIGSIFLETLIAFKKTRDPSWTVGVVEQLLRLNVDPKFLATTLELIVSKRLTRQNWDLYIRSNPALKRLEKRLPIFIEVPAPSAAGASTGQLPVSCTKLPQLWAPQA